MHANQTERQALNAATDAANYPAITSAKLAGRCTSGLELGQGVRVHAIADARFDSGGSPYGQALCKAKPGRRSVGWTHMPDADVTCPACVRKLGIGITPTAASERTTPRRSRKESTALPYPELPKSGGSFAIFWLAAWMRAQKEREEHVAFSMARWLSHSHALASGLVNADTHLQGRADERLTNLIRHGGLLFAWHGTTALVGMEVPQ